MEHLCKGLYSKCDKTSTSKMYLNFQHCGISLSLTVCNYDYVVTSRTLPDGVETTLPRLQGKEPSQEVTRYDEQVPFSSPGRGGAT